LKNSTIGISLLRALANEGFNIFKIDQAKKIAKDNNLNPNYIPKTLHYLLKLGWISRIKKGIYCFNAESGFGTPPHDFEIAAALVSPCAISHWTAMHFHHLTDQTPNKIYATIPTGTSVPRSIKQHYVFVQTKKRHYFGFEKTWINDVQIQITDLERTLIDGLQNPQYCGDFQEVLHAFKTAKDKIDLERIVNYALKLDTAIVKRLGWILDKLGISKGLRQLKKTPIKGFRKLDPTGSLKGPYNKKWMIQENI